MKPWLGVLALMMLAACGGQAPADGSHRAGQLQRPAQAVTAADDSVERLLDFGAAAFPELFPALSASAQSGPFRYRHDPVTGIYLGVVTDADDNWPLHGVYVMGGPFGDVPQAVGTIADFIAARPVQGFVGRQGRHFVLDGQRFRVAGANAVQVLANRERSGALSALGLARQMGANVVRIFGGSEIGSADGSVPTLGADPAWRPYFQSWDPVSRRVVVNEGDNGLRQLDFVVYLAAEMGLRLVIALVDNWDWQFAGVNQYVLWHGAKEHAAFFKDPLIRQRYREWASTLLTRTNTYTGRRYADEPAIMAWELINEASCYAGEHFPAGDCHRHDIEAWIEEMSRHVKSLAPRQLVGVGDQGHFGNRQSAAMGWPYRSTNEPDFETVMRMPSIDFGTYHLYPHDFAHGDRSLSPLAWGLRYLQDREAIARAIGKPALMEEVGARDFAVHAGMWSTWLPALEAEDGAGFLFWGIGARFANGQTVWDAQGYTIYPDSPGATELRTWIARFAHPGAAPLQAPGAAGPGPMRGIQALVAAAAGGPHRPCGFAETVAEVARAGAAPAVGPWQPAWAHQSAAGPRSCTAAPAPGGR